MRQKYALLLMMGLIVGLMLIISGCTNQNNEILNKNKLSTITPQQAYCDDLVSKLDAQIVDTQNPPGRFIISALGKNVSEVGGWLMFVKNNSLDGNYNSYTLTFRTMEKNTETTELYVPMGELYLLTTSNETLPYVVGKFYAFDLTNINIYSAATSGMFIDNDLNKLKLVDYCGTR